MTAVAPAPTPAAPQPFTPPSNWSEVPASKYKPGTRAFVGPCVHCKRRLRRTEHHFKTRERQACSRRCRDALAADTAAVRVKRGRIWIHAPDHPYATKSPKMCGYILRSRAIAEAIFERIFPRHAIFHHVNEDAADDRPDNLLVCDRSFHRWLHVQMEKRRFGTTARWQNRAPS
jgi:hypothetical protein